MRETMSRCAAILILLALGAGGCGVFRGIPSHGGGKRFDEEQRVIAAAVRQSLSQIDLSPLAGRRVQIAIDSIAQDGAGNFTPPGLQSFSLNGNLSSNNGNVIRVDRNADEIAVDDSRSSNSNIGGNLNYQINPSYSSHPFSSAGDLNYLRASLDMQARHAGIRLGGKDPEVILFVLVDVLGTNRSRSDRMVMNSDTLAATCETTYYAIDAASEDLVLPAHRTAATALYRETRGLGVSGVHIIRSVARTEPTALEPHTTRTVVEISGKPHLNSRPALSTVSSEDYIFE